MKQFLVILSGATLATAQAPSGLAAIPSCGQLCISNMVQIANKQFGCPNGNVTCFCEDPRFGYGLRDCAVEACGSAVQSQVLAFGLAYCSSAKNATRSSTPTNTASGAGVVANTGTPSVVSTASGTGAVVVTTSPILTTVTTSSITYTSTIGMTTIHTTMTSASSGSSANTSTSSATSVGSSFTTSPGTSRASSADTASSSSSKAKGAIATAVPLVGAGALAALVML